MKRRLIRSRSVIAGSLFAALGALFLGISEVRAIGFGPDASISFTMATIFLVIAAVSFRRRHENRHPD